MTTPVTTAERGQAGDLRRMKLVATAFFLVATAVYAATEHWHAGGWAGYVNSAAEAGMVGALADWFAVTALFRRPLGLPIPHTAIIPTRKDAIGASLERFVATNFLSEEVVRDKVRRSAPAGRAGGWLAQRAHAERVTAELSALARGALVVLRDEEVQRVLEQTFLRRLADWPWAPPAGRVLAQVVVDGTHHRFVDLAVDEMHRWLLAHRDVVTQTVLDQAPSWTPRWVDEMVANRLSSESIRFVEEVRDQPDHRVRLSLDHFLLQLAKDLRDDPPTIERAEQVKDRLLAHPGMQDAVAAVWATTKRLVLDAVEDPGSELRRRVVEGLASFGERVSGDAELRDKIDRWVEDAGTHVVTTYRDEITAVIGDTVNRWDAQETTRKIELQVGRDLQFIRINGTVVGALAGLAIHAVTVLA